MLSNQNYTFRELKLSDIPEVLRIEKSATDFPWSEKAHSDALYANYPSFLIETQIETVNVVTSKETSQKYSPLSKESVQIVGFVICDFLVHECHLLNIVVNPKFQRKGFAKKLLLHLIEKASGNSSEAIILEVRESNLSAINLYESLGFTIIGSRKNYYRGNTQQDLSREDAIVMKKTL